MRNTESGSNAELEVLTNLAIIFLHIVTDSQFISFRVCGDSAIGVTTHRYLVWLHQTHLPVLVENAKRVPLRLEDNANSLIARRGVKFPKDGYQGGCLL
jgi:hypothetical protein